ncbi:MAG: hypothetical protein WCG98_00610 [bacterium]
MLAELLVLHVTVKLVGLFIPCVTPKRLPVICAVEDQMKFVVVGVSRVATVVQEKYITACC